VDGISSVAHLAPGAAVVTAGNSDSDSNVAAREAAIALSKISFGEYINQKWAQVRRKAY